MNKNKVLVISIALLCTSFLFLFAKKEKPTNLYKHPNVPIEKIRDQIESKKSPEERQAKEERIEKIINEIKSKQRKVVLPKEPRKPSRTYPEERGESFAGKSIATLIRYLNQADFNEIYKQDFHHKSEKAIELRKVANALGDRYLADDLWLSNKQKKVIDQVVIKYIKLCNSGRLNDFEEAKLQMIRFSGVIIPSLLQKLSSDDPYILNFAAQTLTEIKNEEITTKFIRKVYGTTDLNKKRELYRFLELFKNPSQTFFKNRPAQDAVTTKRLYETLVIPAINEIRKEFE